MHSTAAPMPLHSLARETRVTTSGRSAMRSALHARQPHGDVAGALRCRLGQEAPVGAAETLQALVA